MITIKVNAVDVTSSIEQVTITHNMENSMAVLVVKKRFNSTLTWASGQTVYIYDDSNVQLFYGKIRSKPESDDAATTTWQVNCDDIRNDYMLTTVVETFKKNTTVSEALQTLINNYTSDRFGTDDTNKLTYCQMSFANVPLKEAVMSCLSLLEIPCVWRIRYQGGYVYHDFVQAFTTNVGTLDYQEVTSGLFTVNEDEIKNRLTVVSNDIIWPTPSKQYFFYNKSSASIWKEKPNRLQVPLERAPKSLFVYLIIGNNSADFATLANGVKIIWPNIKALNENDGGLIGFDPKDLMKGMYFMPGTYDMTSAGAVTTQYQDVNASVLFTGMVNTTLFNKLLPDAAVYFQSASSNDAPYGWIYLPTFEWMRDNLTLVQQYTGQTIDPDNILGWMITSSITKAYPLTVDNTISQGAHGILPGGTETLKTTNILMLKLYAEAKLAYLSTPRQIGKATGKMWSTNTQVNTFYPMPGDLIDVAHPLRTTYSDVYCQEVVYDAINLDMRYTVTASKNNGADTKLWIANRLKKKAEYQKLTDEPVSNNVTLSDTFQVSDDVNVTTLDGSANGYFNGLARRTWFA